MTPVRVLLVDDDPDDRALARRELAREIDGLETIEVIDAHGFEDALETGGFDLVITDHHLSWTSGLAVLGDVRARYREVPLIMFTGTGSEEVAVEAMKAGLSDYVLKTPEHRTRLVPAARSALERAAERRAKREAEEALRASEAFTSQIVESASVGIAVMDRELRYVEWNPFMEYLSGVEAARVLGLRLWEAFEFLPEEVLRPLLERALGGEFATQPDMFVPAPPPGRDAWTTARLAPLRNAEGEIVGVIVSINDITERKEAEERYRSLVESIPAIVYVDAIDEAMTTQYISPRVEQILGVTAEEYTSDPELWERMLHPDDRARAVAEYRHGRDSGHPFTFEYRAIRPDGRVVWFRDEAVPLRDREGRLQGVQGISYDVTQLREAEAALRGSEERVRRLLARVIEAQEDERARIAADLHDDSIQVMTAVGLRLEEVRRRLADKESIEATEKLLETVHAAIRRLRHLLFDLRPRALDEDGLAAALRLHLERVREQSEIEWHLEDELEDEPSSQVRTTIYRIALEALANVRKHSRARRVDVKLRNEDGGFAVSVHDDGVGFDPDGLSSAPGHLGLSAMSEQAEMLGGWWRVESTPGAGATVEFWVPDAGGVGDP